MYKIKGLPESFESFKELVYMDLVSFTGCIDCGQTFSTTNVYSVAGWRETQLSGLCESCFDRITEEKSDNEDQ